MADHGGTARQASQVTSGLLTKDRRSSNTGIGAERRDNISPWAVASHGQPRWANIIHYTTDYAIATHPCTNTIISTKHMCDWCSNDNAPYSNTDIPRTRTGECAGHQMIVDELGSKVDG